MQNCLWHLIIFALSMSLVMGCGKSQKQLQEEQQQQKVEIYRQDYKAKARQAVDALRTLNAVTRTTEASGVNLTHENNLRDYTAHVGGERGKIDIFLSLDESSFNIEGLRGEIEASIGCYLHIIRINGSTNIFIDANDECFKQYPQILKELDPYRTKPSYQKAPLTTLLAKEAETHMLKADEILKKEQ